MTLSRLSEVKAQKYGLSNFLFSDFIGIGVANRVTCQTFSI